MTDGTISELTLFLTKDVWSKRFPPHMFTVSIEGVRRRTHAAPSSGSTSCFSVGDWLQLSPSYWAYCATEASAEMYYKVTFLRSSTARTVTVWRQFSDFERLHRALVATDRALEADALHAPSEKHLGGCWGVGLFCQGCIGDNAADYNANDDAFVEKRKQELQRYIDSVMVSMMQRRLTLASYPALVDFLQVRRR